MEQPSIQRRMRTIIFPYQKRLKFTSPLTTVDEDVSDVFETYVPVSYCDDASYIPVVDTKVQPESDDIKYHICSELAQRRRDLHELLQTDITTAINFLSVAASVSMMDPHFPIKDGRFPDATIPVDVVFEADDTDELQFALKRGCNGDRIIGMRLFGKLYDCPQPVSKVINCRTYDSKSYQQLVTYQREANDMNDCNLLKLYTREEYDS